MNGHSHEHVNPDAENNLDLKKKSMTNYMSKFSREHCRSSTEGEEGGILRSRKAGHAK